MHATHALLSLMQEVGKVVLITIPLQYPLPTQIANAKDKMFTLMYLILKFWRGGSFSEMYTGESIANVIICINTWFL